MTHEKLVRILTRRAAWFQRPRGASKVVKGIKQMRKTRTIPELRVGAGPVPAGPGGAAWTAFKRSPWSN